LATGSYKNDLAKAKRDVLELVKDPTKGNVYDKVRLICVYCLATTCPSSAIDEVVNALKEVYEGQPTDARRAEELERGVKAITYIKHLRSMKMIPMMGESAFAQEAPKSGGAPTDILSSFMARAQTQATGLLAKATERVGSMLGKIHKHHLTRVVENLCDERPNSEDDSYLYLDPKVKGDVDVKAIRGMRAPTRDVFAFMIGGGCYAEYQNLQMISNERRAITYGSTELVDPSVFLGQLAQLG